MRNLSVMMVFGLAIFLSISPVRAASDSATYLYDALGRLVKITYANGTVITYGYDPAGNRTTQSTTCGANPC